MITKCIAWYAIVRGTINAIKFAVRVINAPTDAEAISTVASAHASAMREMTQWPVK